MKNVKLSGISMRTEMSFRVADNVWQIGDVADFETLN